MVKMMRVLTVTALLFAYSYVAANEEVVVAQADENTLVDAEQDTVKVAQADDHESVEAATEKDSVNLAELDDEDLYKILGKESTEVAAGTAEEEFLDFADFDDSDFGDEDLD